MYNIMLVDDDPIVLVELKSMIEWDALGCALIAEVNNGRAAMEKLKECRPDIVFTDISMPNVSGVQLINHIHELDGSIKVVALSAYEDFDYVRGSLKNGAKDYLLKHRISKESINELIKTLIREIGEEQSPKQPSRTEVSKEDWLYKILNAYADIENPSEMLAAMKLSWLNDDVLLAIGGIDSRFLERIDHDTDEHTIRIMIEETIKYYRDYFMLPLEPGLFLLVFSARERARADIEEVIKQIQATLSRFCGLAMSFAVSDPFRGMETIRTQRQINKTVLLEHYFQGNKYFIVHKEGVEPPDALLDDDNFMQLNEMLYLKEPNIQTYFEDFFADVADRHLSKEWVQALYMKLIAFLKRKIKTMQLDESSIFGSDQPYEVWFSFCTYDDIKAYLVKVCIGFQRELKKSYSKHSLSEKAMRYIEENYKEKVTLRDIANALFVSSSYLSRTFKKSTGFNLVTYINKVKMQHARESILQRKLSLQEIANEIGIQNYNYFYILFKETYGISPSDYIKKLDDEEKERRTK